MSAPGSRLILETILENRFQENIISRFSRLVGVHDDGAAKDPGTELQTAISTDPTAP